MHFRFSLPPPVELQLGALPSDVRRSVVLGLCSAARTLALTGGTWGEGHPVRVEALPAYVLAGPGFQLVYEVEREARLLRVRGLAALGRGGRLAASA